MDLWRIMRTFLRLILIRNEQKQVAHLLTILQRVSKKRMGYLKDRKDYHQERQVVVAKIKMQELAIISQL